MQILYFALVAIGLYLAVDWTLRRLERARGKALAHCSLASFSLLLGLGAGGGRWRSSPSPSRRTEDSEMAAQETSSMRVAPPAERIGWTVPVARVELARIGIAFLRSLMTFFMMVYRHGAGKQNLSRASGA